MIYGCIYVEDPIVTHRQRSDGSGNNDVYRCARIKFESFLWDASRYPIHVVNGAQTFKQENTFQYIHSSNWFSPLFFSLSLSLSLCVCVSVYSSVLMPFFYQYLLQSLPTNMLAVWLDVHETNEFHSDKYTYENEDECLSIFVANEEVGINSMDNIMLSFLLFIHTKMHTCNSKSRSAEQWMLSVLMDKSTRYRRRKRAFQCAKSKQCWNVVFISHRQRHRCLVCNFRYSTNPSHCYGCVSLSAAVRCVLYI